MAHLRCFHGIDTTTATPLVTELHDARRFRRPRQLMAYLGLVPIEHSSGGRRQQGAITKTGNAHVRRVLIESAWHDRHRPRIGVPLRKRRVGQPAAVISLADRGHQRAGVPARRSTVMRLCLEQPADIRVTRLRRELVPSPLAPFPKESLNDP